jgi:hypothetical protein
MYYHSADRGTRNIDSNLAGTVRNTKPKLFSKWKHQIKIQIIKKSSFTSSNAFNDAKYRAFLCCRKINFGGMIRDIDSYYLKKEEPNKSCLLALRTIILEQDTDITETQKWGMPCFCYKKKCSATYGPTKKRMNHTS